MSLVLVDRQRPRRARSLPTPTPRAFRPDIQGLRAVAITLVVLYHAGVPGIRGGYVGVDVFFVISGFLITSHLDRELVVRGRISLTTFYGRRARRLLPPAAIVLVVTLVVARFTLPYTQIASLTRDATYAAFYGINYHLALSGVSYQSAAAPPSALQHYWSLAVEEQFYLVWPVLMIGCAVLGRRHRRVVLLVAITALSLASLYLSVTTTASNGPMAYFSLQTRAWELGAGALTALGAGWVSRVLPVAGARVMGWGGLSVVLGSAVLFTAHTAFPGWAALVPVLGAVAVVVAGLRPGPSSVEDRLLSRRLFQHVGRSSYAWYLWHWPMLIVLPALAGGSFNLAQRLEVIVIAYWLAVLTYFLENASARTVWHASRWLVAGAWLSSVMITVAATIAALLPSLTGTGAVITTVALRSADRVAVQREIRHSLSLRAVPSNMHPTLANAFDNTPWEGHKYCFADLPVTVSRLCTFGDPRGQRTAVLVGDSHADQWLNALSTQAKAAGWRLVQITKAACPISPIPVEDDQLGRPYHECTAFQRHRTAQIAKLQPDLVIGSEADAIGVANFIAPARWASTTMSALHRMAGSHGKVVYIADSPFSSRDQVACLQQHLDDARACTSPRFNSTAMRAYNAALEKAAGRAKAAYVPTMELFCVADACPPVIDSMLTHRDQGHVTRTYAQWLSPIFAPIFEKKAS